MQENDEQKLAVFIRNSNNILIFTGAGISTGSGIPDYRGPEGIWKKMKPVYYQEFLSSEEARLSYWEYKSESWEKYKNAKPTNVHRAVVKLEKANKLLMVVTQNIDGLHRDAGTSEDKLVEIHGTMSAVECQRCQKRYEPDTYYEFFKTNHKASLCTCGGFLKPATISFGQNLREKDLQRAFHAAEESDLMISLGSTLSVAPACMIPLRAAERGIPYIIINRGITDHDNLPLVTLRFEGDVEIIFPPVVDLALHY